MSRALHALSKAVSSLFVSTSTNLVAVPHNTNRVALRIVNTSATEIIYLQYRDKIRQPDLTTTPFANGIGDPIMPTKEIIFTKNFFTYNEVWIHSITGSVSVAITEWG
jgi:hypothetical protein